MSTRYGDSHEYDHGAQFFTARTGSLVDMAAAGQIEQWQPVVTLALKENHDRIWFEPHYANTTHEQPV